ncbi:MAG: DNA starvation/stationary phase protection protein [Nitrososphaera sp.]
MASKLESNIVKTDAQVDIGLEENERKGSIRILTELLADQHVLYIKTKNYHWNVVGPEFADLHKFLEEQYELLDAAIDETAERIRMLGGKTMATMTEYLKYAKLKEEPGEFPDARQMLANLLADHEDTIKFLREGVDEADEEFHDMGTNDFLIGLMQQHEKSAWMIRSFLEGRSVGAGKGGK